MALRQDNPGVQITVKTFTYSFQSFVEIIQYLSLKILNNINKTRDGGGGQWLVRMEWLPAGLSVCQPLLIFPCTIKPRSSLLAPAHPGGPRKRAVNGCGGGGIQYL